MDGLTQEFPGGGRIFIRGDFKRHVWKDDVGYRRIHEWYGFEEMNEAWGEILEIHNLIRFCNSKHKVQKERWAFDDL